MKRTKTWIRTFLIAAACLCGGVGFSMLENGEVTANANVALKTLDAVSLTMKNGASVRYVASKAESGIRFSVNLSESDYLGLEANEGGVYQSVSYGVAIMPYTYLATYGELTEENLFGENAKYDWAQWNGSAWVYSGDNTTKKRITMLSNSEMNEDKDGGQTTVEEFQKLNPEDKEAVLEYLQEFSIYEEVDVKDKKYILVHADIHGYEDKKMLEDYHLEDFLFYRAEYHKSYFKDESKILATGHTPTFTIREDRQPLVFNKNGHLAIDCGCVYGGNLAVYCLDNGRMEYVKRKSL